MNTTKDLANHILPDAITDIINIVKPDFVLFAGDIVEGYGLRSQNLNDQLTNNFFPYISTLKTAGIPAYGVRGNHEACLTLWDSVSGWNSAWAASSFGQLPQNGPSDELGLTYSFVYNNALIVMMDQFAKITPLNEYICNGGTGYNIAINQTWLNSILAANTSKHIFVVGHIQMFDYSTWDGFADFTSTTVRNTFWDSLVNAHADAFIAGHSHVFNFSQITKAGDPHSVYQVIEGAGKKGAIPQTYPSTQGTNTPYTVTELKDYHSDSTAPATSGLALGYLVVEVSNTEPSVTYTWKKATWDSRTSHWVFNNYYYYKYTK
jgi:hypothetical protein